MAETVTTSGANSRIQTFGSVGSNKTSQQTVYVTPSYLLKAARRKYGRNIFVIGAVESELAKFWDNVKTKGTTFDPNDTPTEDGRIVVDITAKEHCNLGTYEDKINIVTVKEEKKKQKKSYSISFGKQSGWEFGGGLNIGASFFNTASASIGIQGKRTKEKWKLEDKGKEEERSLSQTYGVTGKITVPANTKVTATITTYAVTYKLNIKTILSAPSTSSIPFYYKSFPSTLFCAGAGPTCRKLGHITPSELFQNEDDFKDLKYAVQFTKECQLSYIAEVAEVSKEETPL